MYDGQGSLACCRPWGCKESDMTWRLNNYVNALAPAQGAQVSGVLGSTLSQPVA